MKLVLDSKQTLKKKTRDQPLYLRKLRGNGSKVQLRLAKGESLAEHYAKVNKYYEKQFFGACHAKTSRVDEKYIVGSTNWTTASRGSYECCLVADGQADHDEEV